MQARPSALVIDATEWFVDEAWRDHVTPRHWRRLPARAPVAIRNVVAALGEGVRATFFVPWDLCERDPELLRELRRHGHEVGLAGLSALPLDEVLINDREQLIERFRREREDLERVLGEAVHGFCSCYAAVDGPRWWVDELRNNGFDYDLTQRRMDGADVIDGVEVRRFRAWRLDDGQPPLMGLPRDVRLLHEQEVKTGADALKLHAAKAATTVAKLLELSPRTVDLPPRPASQPSVRARTDAPVLSIVIPLMNEADGVHALFRELDVLSAALADVVACTFVCVDDGSTDRTWELLEQLTASRDDAKLVRHEQNRGVAAAIQTGIAACDSNLVASIDGDLSYDPMELRAMVKLLFDNAADVVTASPYHPDGGVQNVPGWRLFLSRTLSFAYRVLLLRSIRTWTACFRVYRREAVASLPLKNEGFLGTAELLVRVLRRGGKVVEHPCVLEARLLGFSKMRVLRTVMGHVRLLAQVLVRQVR